MDALLELVLQLVFEVVGEFLVDFFLDRDATGVAYLVEHRRGRWVIGFLAGLGFGCAWGAHLSGQAHYPRLLWVSLTLGIVAGVAALRHRTTPRQPARLRARRVPRALLTWDRDRFIGLVAINAGLAIGVVLVFKR